MDLVQLEQFRLLARVQHMTRAAEELNIAQPSLSKTIQRLERELGVALFDRPGRQIRLNSFGRAFLERVDEAFFALEEGQRQVRSMADLEQGEIALHARLATVDPTAAAGTSRWSSRFGSSSLSP